MGLDSMSADAVSCAKKRLASAMAAYSWTLRRASTAVFVARMRADAGFQPFSLFDERDEGSANDAKFSVFLHGHLRPHLVGIPGVISVASGLARSVAVRSGCRPAAGSSCSPSHLDG
jgi:hypothetical protein